MSRGEKAGPESNRATGAEVARMAGVSGATVSLVLNGRAGELGISSETGNRVKDAAARVPTNRTRSASLAPAAVANDRDAAAYSIEISTMARSLTRHRMWPFYAAIRSASCRCRRTRRQRSNCFFFFFFYT